MSGWLFIPAAWKGSTLAIWKAEGETPATQRVPDRCDSIASLQVTSPFCTNPGPAGSQLMFFLSCTVWASVPVPPELRNSWLLLPPQEVEDPLGMLDPYRRVHAGPGLQASSLRNQSRQKMQQWSFHCEDNVSPVEHLVHVCITSLRVAPRDPARARPLTTLSPSPQSNSSSRCLGAIHPSQEFAFASVLGLPMRFHLQKRVPLLKKCLWRPHNGDAAQVICENSYKSSEAPDSGGKNCTKKCREYAQEA